MKNFLTVLFLACSVSLYAEQFAPVQLKCEYQINPVGIQSKTPRFSWQVSSLDRGFLSTGYELWVAESKSALEQGSELQWKAVKQGSDEALHIPYKGKALKAGHAYFWKVRVKNKSGIYSPWSETAQFSTALFAPEDWSGAQWIAMEVQSDDQRIVPGYEYNKLKPIGDRKTALNKLPQFRKQIHLSKPLKRAVAYVSGLGQFEFFINGEKVGNNFLDPAWTDFDRSIAYVPFDVTSQLQKGDNVLGVMLGNGMFNVPRERYFKLIISYGYPMMIMKLQLEYKDGSSETIVSDQNWKASASPVTYSSIFGGEDYDATLYQSGWMKPGFDDTQWKPVLKTNVRGQLEVSKALPVKVMEEFPSISIRKTKYGKWLYDLGQNFSGTIQIRVKGVPGQKVEMNTCELFDPAVDSITVHGGYRGEYRLSYTTGSRDAETWHPQFTYFGQRYVLVNGGIPAGEPNPLGLPVIEEIRGLHIRNAAPTTGSFECSNDLFNKTFRMISWGIKSNMVSYFTDCPHREKLPWIEQLHLMFGSLQYSFDVLNLYEKMVGDMHLAQFPSGLIPDITPMYATFMDGFIDSPEWGSAFVISPWKVYEYYGDKQLLETYYEPMKKYVSHLSSRADHHILNYGLGDWFDLGPKSPGKAQLSSLAATATPTYYMDVEILKKTAALLGKKQDESYFAKLADSIKSAYNAAYYNQEKGYYDRNSQAANAIALYAGLVAPENKDKVLANLIGDIRQRGNALTGGDVGYTYILRVLEENNASQVIYDMNSRYDVPGYGYMLAKGSTSLPESWQVVINKSHNHFMLGHLQEWFFTHLAGIQKDPTALAYKKIIIQPHIVGDVNHAQASFESPYGAITNQWKIVDGKLTMKVQIPANTTARVFVPLEYMGVKKSIQDVLESGVPATRSKGVRFVSVSNGYAVFEVGSGDYNFSS